MAINTVLNLRNTGTIYQEDNELPIPSGALTHDNIDRLIDKMLLSAAITTAAFKNIDNNGLSGLTGIFYENWGSNHKDKKINAWLKNAKVQEAIKTVLGEAQEILKESD